MRIWITDIQRFSIHDGPGIRTTVFFQGCPLRCAWCQNPECQIAGPRLRFSAGRCMGCGACKQVCPHGGHKIADGTHTLARDKCEVCGKCAECCPTGALGIVGRQSTPEEIMQVVRKDFTFYQQSGGGVTLSGGEPLAQAKGARALLHLARAEGIHNAVETCGHADWRSFEPLLEAVDLWLYDIKHMGEKEHRVLTGVYNRRILANLRRLLERGAQVTLRMPIIPGYNDGFFDRRLVELLEKHNTLREVHLMPYNQLAESKYEPLGLQYELRGTQPPPEEELQQLKARLEELGVEVRVGG